MKTSYFVLSALLMSPLAAAQQEPEPDTYFPQQMTAKDLLLACASSSLTARGRERRRYCYGFVSGVEEGIRLQGLQFPAETGNSLCVPKGTTSREMANLYIKHASGKNIDLNLPAASIVLEALKSAYPCRQ